MAVELVDRTDMADCDASTSGRHAPVSGLDELFQAMERMQIPEGYKAEIVEGAIVVSPQRDSHWDLIAAVYDQLRVRYARKQIKSGVRIDFPGGLNGFCPDLVVLRQGAEKNDKGLWEHQDVEYVSEVISRGTDRNDYGPKKKAYAVAEVAAYLIADPYTGECHLHTRPKDGTFWTAQTFAFGERIDLKEAGIDVVLETGDFPRG
ncbi:Uma2 family endonuclease [Streptomyces zingiberis]|uniref:Uma2 family endonuclease n=1 Tax=Streptomyces zingiberis TaxID=2053010 RepID=A0ABX1C3S2_9ACTN|nr:Uma2 family endonuclease [Streptomyces zingiberis]NJQ02274.1 Uma2 family endonuclease [Streptomyces zingiberis]